MKKISAKVLSFILTAALILSFAPSVMAEGEVVLPTGNAEGRLTEGLTIKVGNGTDMAASSILADGFHYSIKEVIKDTTIADDTTHTSVLSAQNNTVEFSWTEPKSVKRIELWIYTTTALGTYRVEVSDDEIVWNEVTTGEFPFSLSTGDPNTGITAAFYPVIFNPVTTKFIRIVFTGITGDATAKIAEAIPRSNDNVNLLGWNNLAASYADSNSNTYCSPYAYGFRMSDLSYPTVEREETGDRRYARNYVWPFWWGDARVALGAPYKSYAATAGYDYTGFWYSTQFLDTQVAVNKVKVNIARGTIKEFQILYNQSDFVSLPETWSQVSYIPSPETVDTANWKVAATVSGTFTASTDAEVYIPNAPKAKYWLVKFTDYTTDARVEPFEFYTMGGDVNLFGKGASFGNGANESVLSDDAHYFNYNTPSDRTPSNNLDKLAKFTSVDSGIIFKLSETVKRLDLWTLSHGGIQDYEIQTSEDGSVWSTHQSGSFTKYDNTVAENATRASYYPVVLQNEVTAKYMRFVIKSFYDNSKGAYISEAKLYNHNNIDFTQQGVYGTGAGKINYSPYVRNYFLTQGIDTLAGFTKGETAFFPADSNGNIKGIAPDANACWYVTDFFRSKVKVNRVGINISTGTISEFEVWACVPDNKTMSSWGGTGELAVDPLLAGNASLWQMVGKISCNLSNATNNLTFDIPRSVEANAWMIRPTVYSGNLYIPSVEMYSVAESELGAVVEAGTITVSGDSLAAGSEVTYSGYSYKSSYPNAAVFFALYSGDALVEVSRQPMAISGSEHSAEYTIPLTAGENLSLKAFLWDGVTLAPILSNPATK